MTGAVIKNLGDALLGRWGEWQRTLPGVSLGPPSCDPVEGYCNGRGGRDAVVEFPDEAEIERLDLFLARRLSRVLLMSVKAEYIWRLSEREAADRCRTSRSTHRRRVEAAQEIVEGEFCQN